MSESDTGKTAIRDSTAHQHELPPSSSNMIKRASSLYSKKNALMSESESEANNDSDSDALEIDLYDEFMGQNESSSPEHLTIQYNADHKKSLPSEKGHRTEHKEIEASYSKPMSVYSNNRTVGMPSQNLRNLRNNDSTAFDSDSSSETSSSETSSVPPLYNTALFQPELNLMNSQNSTFGNLGVEKSHSSYSEDPLYFLASQEQFLKAQLEKYITHHESLSKSGSASTSNLRKNIQQCFSKLALVYQSMSEIYEKEEKRKFKILNSFTEWESNKKFLKHEIEEIRSNENGEGLRLNQLLSQSDAADDEIKSLEIRLKQLKEKKQVLQNEIIQSQSIIESRSSSYIESLNEVEATERELIHQLSRERSAITGLSKTFQERSGSKSDSIIGRFFLKLGSQMYDSTRELNMDPIFEMLQREIASFQDGIENYRREQLKFDENSIIWNDTTNILNNLESDLNTVLKSSSASKEETRLKAQSLLRKNIDMLLERQKQIPSMDRTIKNLFKTEISTLTTGIRFLSGKEPESESELVVEQQKTPKSVSPAFPSPSPSPSQLKIKDSRVVVSSSPPLATLALGGGSFTSNATTNSLKETLLKNQKAAFNKSTKSD